MTPASLGPALFTPPPPDAGATVTTDSGPGAGDGGFARLLQPATTPAAASSGTPVSEPVADAQPATDDFPTLDASEDGTEDAPWPPPGLETLLAPPPPPAIATAAALALPAAGSPGIAAAGVHAAATGLAASPSALAGLAAARPAVPALPANQPTGGNPLPAGMARMPGLANATGEALLPAADAMATAALAEEAITGLLAGNPAGATAGAAAGDAMPLAAMAALGATAGASPLPAADAQASVVPTRADMGGEHFDQDVAEGVQYMLDNKLQSARIRISPQHLGMIEVELRLDGDRVHANFSSAQSEVRQALNDSLPRLRELLDAQGLEMGQTAVADQGRDRPSAGGQDSNGTGNTPASATTLAGSAAGEAASTPVWRHQGLLDAYA